jgi:hypothetical protein
LGLRLTHRRAIRLPLYAFQTFSGRGTGPPPGLPLVAGWASRGQSPPWWWILR